MKELLQEFEEEWLRSIEEQNQDNAEWDSVKDMLDHEDEMAQMVSDLDIDDYLPY